MFKYILKMLVLTFIFSFKLLPAKLNHEIQAEDLHIYNILNNAKIVLMEDLAKTNNKNYQGSNFLSRNNLDKDNLSQKALDLINKEISLLKEIVHGFNNGLMFFAEYKFISLCNFFNNIEDITPRDIRAFGRKATKFDNFIQNYSSKKKSLLDSNEIELCEKILIFDQILLACCLRSEFYNIATFDKITDKCFYRPVEWMGEHPLITGAVIAVISFILFYNYVYPNLNFSDTEIKDGCTVVKNKNSVVNVTQFKQEKTQHGLTCGAHATFNIIAMIKGKGDPKATYDLINNEKDRAACFARWQAIIPNQKGLNSLDGNEIEDILLAEKIENVTVIRDSGMLRENKFADFNDMYHFVDGIFINEAGHEVQINGNKVPDFNNGNTQYFIVNTAERTDLKKENAYGHWLPFMFLPGSKAVGVRAFTVDSSHNNNRTDDWRLNRLHQILVHGN